MSTPAQTPQPGQRLIRHTGDIIQFVLDIPPHEGNPAEAWLRTNIGYAGTHRREIIERTDRHEPVLARDWHDLPLKPLSANRFAIDLPLSETGRFEAKTYYVSGDDGKVVWVPGENTVIKVEPADYASANTLYSAFIRQFSSANNVYSETDNDCIRRLDGAGYHVIPRSGTFRDMLRQLDIIIKEMGFRIIQLLPIHPVPTTYARMGRFGSPFACLDFMDIDPALAEFDRQTTPLDQFHELADGIHSRHARLFIDIPINHTGWASWLQVHHPEWFARNNDRSFQSPGAWGVTWEDLSKLDYRHRELWQYMADVFLYWCRQGVDGFRCDAGYMVPYPVWEYITARVREEFPDTIFMLEGLGGRIETMQSLLDGANLDWAYSELFQNYDQRQISEYLQQANSICREAGLLVHFAETHDNNRLAAASPAYSRMRTAMSALFSHQGAFGITNGVEWFATEKIDVHELNRLNWGKEPNQCKYIQKLNQILTDHPCFQPETEMRLIQKGNYNTLVLLRTAPVKKAQLLVLVNLNESRPALAAWHQSEYRSTANTDLLTGRNVNCSSHSDTLSIELAPAAVMCLSPAEKPETAPVLHGTQPYLPLHVTRTIRYRALAAQLIAFWQKANISVKADLSDIAAALRKNPRQACVSLTQKEYPPVIQWRWPNDTRRTILLPPGYAVLITADSHFIAEIRSGEKVLAHQKSLPCDCNRWFAILTPASTTEVQRHLTVHMTVFDQTGTRHSISPLLQLAPFDINAIQTVYSDRDIETKALYAICTNGRGALSQVRGAWGSVQSIYDAMLSANLDQQVPVDRHIMLTRCRAWLVYRDYSQEINIDGTTAFFQADNGSVCWQFQIPCGMGRHVSLEIMLRMIPFRNRIELVFSRKLNTELPSELEADEPINIIIRPDIEDRNFHHCTKAYSGPESEWPAAIETVSGGFIFTPAAERHLSMTTAHGEFVYEPEWNYNIPHPVEEERGLESVSDLFSPGWFRLTLTGGTDAEIAADVTKPEITTNQASAALQETKAENIRNRQDKYAVLRRAISAFIVTRDSSQTVIAGYPWFLDWGRDTLICLRGIIAAGYLKSARDILTQFAGFERDGTLPNMIRGNDDSNRDTSDAPLWFFVAVADLLQAENSTSFLETQAGGRSIRAIMVSIAENYLKGTPNGIRVDPESGLVFSPSHYTWMDTNHPAATPREGYPVEIQALWYAALRLLMQHDNRQKWESIAKNVQRSIAALYVIKGHDGLSDCLHCAAGTPAREAIADDACRSNQLFCITLGAVDNALAQRIIQACEKLLVPGAIRSLADAAVQYQQPVYHDGILLNDPLHPYWGHYRGTEDSRRKPAYHNGTAWTWPFPSFCEALYLSGGEAMRQTALDLLGSCTALFNAGCIGHLPEIIDGSTPHKQRGCGAQAWGVCELLRVIQQLDN